MARMHTKRITRNESDPHSVFFIAASIYKETNRICTASYIHTECAKKFNEHLDTTSNLLFVEKIENWCGQPIIVELGRIIGASSRGGMTYSEFIARFPQGLCGDLRNHDPHLEDSLSFGLFKCHADQSLRLR